MKIYTRTGDDGTTALFGGDRVSKTHSRIAAYGTVDEINSHVGLARSLARDHPETDRLDEMLAVLQGELFTLGADLATPSGSRAQVPRITNNHVERLERAIDELEADLPPLKHFILPGGRPAAAALHVARTVCRRAERHALEARDTDDISAVAVVYLNRLSDYLFVLGRWTNRMGGEDEPVWRPEPRRPEK